MRYMVIERFKNDAARAIYERAGEQGRLLPDGLTYLNSWVSTGLDSCFQLMECGDERLFDQWFARWSDLADFELVPVMSSAQASALVLGDNAGT